MIKITGLTVKYGVRTIIDNIDLEVNKGETLVVMGLSGMGKSTILKSLIGLLKPSSGQIFIMQQDVTKLNSNKFDKIRKRMGMVFQSGALFDSLNIGENVAFGLREHKKLKEEEIQKIVSEKLSIVDLEGKELYMPSQLSGGMQKRASLARTIATDPEIILYDEPTTGLDPIMSCAISNLIIELRNKYKVTSVVVTHDLQSAFSIADKIAMLYRGKIIEVSKPEDFRNSKNPIVRQFVEGSVQGPIKV